AATVSPVLTVGLPFPLIGLDLHTQPLQTSEGAGAIRRRGIIVDFAGPFGQTRQNRQPVRNGLIPRHNDSATHCPPRRNELRRHGAILTAGTTHGPCSLSTLRENPAALRRIK